MSKCKDCIHSDENKTKSGAIKFIYCSKMTDKNIHFGRLSEESRKELVELYSQSLLLIYREKAYVYSEAFCSSIECITDVNIDNNCDCGMNHTQFASVISSHSTWCKIHKK